MRKLLAVQLLAVLTIALMIGSTGGLISLALTSSIMMWMQSSKIL